MWSTRPADPPQKSHRLWVKDRCARLNRLKSNSEEGGRKEGKPGGEYTKQWDKTKRISFQLQETGGGKENEKKSILKIILEFLR